MTWTGLGSQQRFMVRSSVLVPGMTMRLMSWGTARVERSGIATLGHVVVLAMLVESGEGARNFWENVS